MMRRSFLAFAVLVVGLMPAPGDAQQADARWDGHVVAGPVTFQSPGTRFLVTDLAEGTWRVVRDCQQSGTAVTVSGESRVLWF